jgi:flagellum-specific peptidoglycan hydrolase FlgJ
MRKVVLFFTGIISFVFIYSTVSSEFTKSQKYTLSDYILEFRPFAVKEMNRSGIPASVTLAQAILESAYGNSTLAIFANNHFGIKCKPDWKGETYPLGNDCYKKYGSALESYQDHSNHIRSRAWYKDLFKLKITDYKGWAFGLKRAGYAEDPNYAYSLIQIIEMYNFRGLDSLYTPADSAISK